MICSVACPFAPAALRATEERAFARHNCRAGEHNSPAFRGRPQRCHLARIQRAASYRLERNVPHSYARIALSPTEKRPSPDLLYNGARRSPRLSPSNYRLTMRFPCIFYKVGLFVLQGPQVGMRVSYGYVGALDTISPVSRVARDRLRIQLT
jgi:hypothetical protein